MTHQHPRRALDAPWQVRVALVAVPGVLAGLVATGAMGVGTGSSDTVAVPAPAVTASSSPSAVVREQPASRSTARPALTKPATSKPKAKAAAKPKTAAKSKPKAAAKTKKPKATKAKVSALPKVKRPSLEVVDTEYTRVDLNVREAANIDADLITVLGTGSKVSVTQTVRDGWKLISYQGDAGWVRTAYLAETKPKPKPEAAPEPASSGSSKASSSSKSSSSKSSSSKSSSSKSSSSKSSASKSSSSKSSSSKSSSSTKSSSSSSSSFSSAACSGGSGMESGLTPDAIRVHRAICARFPAVSSFGGVRAVGGAHGSGRAVDAMVSDSAARAEVAAWVRANARQLGVSEVIYSQKIWTVQRSSEGWRGMADRGSVSANHYDHVHVTVYGNSGG